VRLRKKGDVGGSRQVCCCTVGPTIRVCSTVEVVDNLFSESRGETVSRIRRCALRRFIRGKGIPTVKGQITFLVPQSEHMFATGEEGADFQVEVQGFRGGRWTDSPVGLVPRAKCGVGQS